MATERKRKRSAEDGDFASAEQFKLSEKELQEHVSAALKLTKTQLERLPEQIKQLAEELKPLHKQFRHMSAEALKELDEKLKEALKNPCCPPSGCCSRKEKLMDLLSGTAEAFTEFMSKPRTGKRSQHFGRAHRAAVTLRLLLGAVSSCCCLRDVQAMGMGLLPPEISTAQGLTNIKFDDSVPDLLLCVDFCALYEALWPTANGIVFDYLVGKHKEIIWKMNKGKTSRPPEQEYELRTTGENVKVWRGTKFSLGKDNTPKPGTVAFVIREIRKKKLPEEESIRVCDNNDTEQPQKKRRFDLQLDQLGAAAAAEPSPMEMSVLSPDARPTPYPELDGSEHRGLSAGLCSDADLTMKICQKLKGSEELRCLTNLHQAIRVFVTHHDDDVLVRKNLQLQDADYLNYIYAFLGGDDARAPCVPNDFTSAQHVEAFFAPTAGSSTFGSPTDWMPSCTAVSAMPSVAHVAPSLAVTTSAFEAVTRTASLDDGLAPMFPSDDSGETPPLSNIPSNHAKYLDAFLEGMQVGYKAGLEQYSADVAKARADVQAAVSESRDHFNVVARDDRQSILARLRENALNAARDYRDYRAESASATLHPNCIRLADGRRQLCAAREKVEFWKEISSFYDNTRDEQLAVELLALEKQEKDFVILQKSLGRFDDACFRVQEKLRREARMNDAINVYLAFQETARECGDDAHARSLVFESLAARTEAVFHRTATAADSDLGDERIEIALAQWMHCRAESASQHLACSIEETSVQVTTLPNTDDGVSHDNVWPTEARVLAEKETAEEKREIGQASAQNHRPSSVADKPRTASGPLPLMKVHVVADARDESTLSAVSICLEKLRADCQLELAAVGASTRATVIAAVSKFCEACSNVALLAKDASTECGVVLEGMARNSLPSSAVFAARVADRERRANEVRQVGQRVKELSLELAVQKEAHENVKKITLKREELERSKRHLVELEDQYNRACIYIDQECAALGLFSATEALIALETRETVIMQRQDRAVTLGSYANSLAAFCDHLEGALAYGNTRRLVAHVQTFLPSAPRASITLADAPVEVALKPERPTLPVPTSRGGTNVLDGASIDEQSLHGEVQGDASGGESVNVGRMQAPTEPSRERS